MTYIGDLLTQTVAPRIQAELQPHLRAFYGGLLRGYLPQIWWFTTESGTATLYVDANGTAQVYEGQSGQPDVRLTWTDQDAYTSLTSQDARSVPAGVRPPQVQVMTRKGKAAYDQLRQRLKL